MLNSIRTFLTPMLLIFLVPAAAIAERTVRIAVIDTGVDSGHPHIAKYIWRNPGESGIDSLGRDKSGNGVDDDGNGFIDDVSGWNFVTGTPNVNDLHGHGTHIAGIIKDSAVRSGVPFTLIPLKYYDQNDNRKNLKERFFGALKYAIDSNVDIINISAGGRMFDAEEKALLQTASQKGILVVAAAGNKSPQAKSFDFFPASYQLPNVFSVVAIGSRGKPLATSNMSPHKNHFFAPGYNIHSSLPNDAFGNRTGSSQAAAFFTGHIVPLVGRSERAKSGPQYFAELKDVAITQLAQ